MADTFAILSYGVIGVSLLSLAYGSYTDVKRRTVKALLFVPLIVVGLAMNIFLHAPVQYMGIAILIFLMTFLKPDTYAYGFFSGVFILISVLEIFLIGFYYGFQLLILSTVFALGFTERMFGIGDIKGIIALMFASTLYTPISQLVLPGNFLYSSVPTSLAVLVDIAIFSVIFMIYAAYLAGKYGSVRARGEYFAIKYNDSVAAKNSSAFRIGEKDGEKYMAYRIPFMVAILLGYLMFMTIGSPIFL